MSGTDLNLARGAASADGLTNEESALIRELLTTWRRKRSRNMLRERYYLGHVRVKDLGIAMPASLSGKIDPRIDWPRKAVHALADRSVLNGFTSDDEATASELREIYRSNSLASLYRKALICELKHCCAFWTVTTPEDDERAPIISVYPATAASAVWDDERKSIRGGLVVAESKRDADGTRAPSVINVFTEESVIVLRRSGRSWSAENSEHGMGRPLMEPMAYGATLERPFGSSRITRAVMSIADDAIRQRARMEIAAESSTLPQMWLLGTEKRVISDEQRYDASMGAINEITKDADGDVPTVWQSAQLQMAPLSDYLRNLACQMSSATNVPVSFFGVNSDNPSSSEAIASANEPLIIDARNLNDDNGAALRNVALMALAVRRGTDFETERDAGSNINARFMSPAHPSAVSQSDAMLKQAQAFPKIASSDVALEMLGYTDEQMQRINSDYRRAQARQGLAAILPPEDGDQR